MKIFFSHSSKDKSLVREVKSKMYPFLDIWLDEKELLPGENLEDQIRWNIDTSDYVVIFISKSSIDSKWIKYECERAIAKEQKMDRPFLIPILIDECPILEGIDLNRYYLKLPSQGERDVNNLAEDLNKRLYHLIIRYGCSPSSTKHGIKEEKGNSMEPTVDFVYKILSSTTDSEVKRYINLISLNCELGADAILVLLEDEAESVVIDVEASKLEREEAIEKEKGVYKSLLIGEKICFETKEKISKNLLRKIRVFRNNATKISSEEALYALRKYLNFIQSEYK